VNAQPEPDDKDWTWVLRERCPECGFDAGEPDRDALADLVDEVGSRWVAVMGAHPAAGTRPAPTVWSPLEYACHVRDVLALATYRIGLMLEEDEPAFANWDQDATAIAEDYASQDTAVVCVELGANGREFAEAIRAVPADGWQRRGLRGDGAQFTVESFVRYLLHDPIHHLTDVTGRSWA
jgi:hypothetical protein